MIDSTIAYISKLEEPRQKAVEKIIKTITDNLPSGFQEIEIYNMIGFVVPKSIYPDGYHVGSDLPLPFINIAAQKNFIALYHMGIYAKPELQTWFVTEYSKHCKYKLDMGKSCIRFKKIEDIPYKLIGELVTKMTVEEWVSTYKGIIKK